MPILALDQRVLVNVEKAKERIFYLKLCKWTISQNVPQYKITLQCKYQLNKSIDYILKGYWYIGDIIILIIQPLQKYLFKIENLKNLIITIKFENGKNITACLVKINLILTHCTIFNH